MNQHRRSRPINKWTPSKTPQKEGEVRIIGGKFRGRRLAYSGDPVTRPMKDITREAVFNLVGGYVPGKIAFDLFAGTGAVGLEAISRGAEKAYLIDRHFPTVKVIRDNVAELDVSNQVVIEAADTFFWVRSFLKQPIANTTPWLVFCCPPYSLYVSQRDQIVTMLQDLVAVAPPESVFVVEADGRFDAGLLPVPQAWKQREYPPAIISIRRLSADNRIERLAIEHEEAPELE